MIVYDLDGTLFDDPPHHLSNDRHFWTDPTLVAAHVQPIQPVCDLVRDLYQAGYTPRVGYVTARPDALREVTETQLQEAGLPEGPLAMAPCRWSAEDALSAKTKALTELKATLYVGDMPYDREAAELAGCRHLSADVLHVLAGALP